ncbi:MAG TPA: hypothetical protein VM513_10725 [Kofleriaceae bacterium]|nr:hypothetical protein [Kofleriaceae bacterium]
MIAERMRAACWVAAGLAVASAVIIALRSPAPARVSTDYDDRDFITCPIHTTREEVQRLERELQGVDRRIKLLIEHNKMTRELLDEGARRQRELERNDMLLRPPAHASTNG